MNARRIIGIAALAAAAAGVLTAPTAGAQDAEGQGTVEYAASADGVGLSLVLFGEEVTAGKTHVEVDSGPTALAQGAGLLNPLSPAGVTEAEVTAEGSEGSAEETCEGELVEIPGLAVALACSSSLATIAGGGPSSTSTGRVAGVTVNPVEPLLDTPLAEVVEGVDGGVEQLLDGLSPITGPIDEGTELGLDDTLRDLFGALFDGADLVTLTLGPTESSTTVAGGAVTSTCTASGGRLDVLDAAEIEGVDAPPVMSIIIGDASTSVTAPLDGGEAQFTVDPSIATVIVPSMNIEQPIGPGDTVEIPLPEPLGTSTISIAGGTTGTTDDGQTFARASAIRLDLLNGEAMQGGIELALADCLSVAGATFTPALPAAPPVEPLPRTGGPDGLALAGVIALAGASLTLVRRTKVDGRLG